jgi:hypothetical protein
MLDFEWSPGMAVSQKQKNVSALHQAATAVGIEPVLEVSTKSTTALGVQLSAFNLKMPLGQQRLALEALFQGSKVFQRGGPFTDLYELDAFAIKRDDRLRESGALIAFDWRGQLWPLEPRTAFYDWLYLNALASGDVGAALSEFAGFTDIEFNPAKSINCQARSCALYVALRARGRLEKVLTAAPEDFRAMLSGKSKGGSQGSLL